MEEGGKGEEIKEGERERGRRKEEEWVGANIGKRMEGESKCRKEEKMEKI